MNVIVIGNGGREHALAWKISESERVEKVICVPGNGGSANEPKCVNVDLNACAYIKSGENPYVQIARHENCSLCVIGPEEPLANGLSDIFWEAGIPCVGPKMAAAQLEASKDFSKEFMQKYGVACAQSRSFTSKKAANEYIRQHGTPIVIKADGLAAGKGVVVAATEHDAFAAVEDLMESGRVGDAGKKLVIEDYLQGVEISVLAAVSVSSETIKNGTSAIVPFLPARDHKRLLDGAKGPNTGGMGAICPVEDVSEKTMELFKKNCLEPTLNGLIQEKFDYRGFIFFGVMLTKDGPKLLEYNVRLGDPETQAVLPLMDSDFVEMCMAILNGTLHDFSVNWKKGFQVAPVVVSGGYPESYPKGKIISIDEHLVSENKAKIFVAGAVMDRRSKTPQLVTNGGRVLCCSAFGETFKAAWENAYGALEGVSFEGSFHRNDIGLPGAAESGEL